MATKPVIYVIYYSMYGHIATLGDAVIEGMKKNDNVEVKIFRIDETLPEEVLEKMHAPPKRVDIPIITPEDLPNADAFMLGLPTRFGNPPAQFKAFWDATGSLWQKGELAGKMAGTFFSTASQSGGQETTAWTLLPNLVHHNIIYVPLGYSKAYPQLTDSTQVSGGSAYGAGTVAGGDGSRTPSANELIIANAHGEYFAQTVAQFVNGKAKLAAGTRSDAAPVEAAAATANTGDVVPTNAAPTETTAAATVNAEDAAPVEAAESSAPSGPTKKESKLKRMMKRISRIF